MKKHSKSLKRLLSLFLVLSWLLTSWPGVLELRVGEFDLRFPPKIQEADAATAGPKFAGTGADGGDGADCTWSNPSNATGDTTSTSAACSLSAGGTKVSNTLRLTNFGFTSTDVPSGSTINGVTVEVEWLAAGTQTTDTTVQLTTNGTSGTGDNKAAGTSQTTKGFQTYGGTSDGWNASLTQSNVTSTSFGVFLRYTKAGGGNQTTNVYRARITIDYTAPTTTLGTGTDASSTTVAPGSGIREAGAFSFQTNSGTDSITQLNVSLAGSGTPYDGLAQAEIRATNCSGTQYYNSITSFSGNSLTFSGGTSISATTTQTEYKICLTPLSHANMPVPPGAEYALSSYVTDWTGTNAKAGTDSNSNTLTIDNLSPNGATSTSGTAGDANVTLNWTSSSSSDFDTTNGSVILRWASGSAGSEVPQEGNSSYTAGNTISTATVACVISSATSTSLSRVDGSGGDSGCTTSALTNGQQYTYVVFQRDTRGNYDTGVSIGTFTPEAATPATFTLSNYRWYQDDDTLNPANAWGESLAANTAIVAIPSANDPPEPARELRLRVNMTVNDANLSASDRYFKLQYKQGTDATCTTGSWTDVGAGGGGSIWRYAVSSVTDGTTLTISRLSSDVLQVYIKANPSALNPNSATQGQTMEYDFHIEHNGAVNASQYSFRVVETDATGTPTTELNAYTNCPTLTTRPGVENFMRHGNFYVDEVLQGFFWAD